MIDEDGMARRYGSPGPVIGPGGAPARRAFGAPYESITFSTATRARTDLTITLAAQPVFELSTSTPVSRRLRRSIRRCGERTMFERKTLELADLRRIDALTLQHGMELLRLGPSDCGIVPAFWRSLTENRESYALMCAEAQHSPNPGSLLVEVVGGPEQAPLDVIDDIIGRFETGSRGLILHIAPDIDTARRLRGARVSCLAIDFAGVAHDGARDWQAAVDLIAAARQSCSQILLTNLRPERALGAQAAGATHAVFASLEPRMV
ncbi:MAG: hypothetical protein SWI22_00275 [Pseudomonadota bacterium]|nr:hypothetical protein [Pseudomonadota bacterium]